MIKREIRIEGAVGYVPLSMGLVAIIDAADANMVSGWCWSAKVMACTTYAYRTVRQIGTHKTTLYLHRSIFGCSDAALCVDHVNGDGLDNRRANLRLASRSQNNCNRRLLKDSVSGFKGVSWAAKNLKWQARIQVAGRQYYLGLFDSADDAARAYADAAKELHGEFAQIGVDAEELRRAG